MPSAYAGVTQPTQSCQTGNESVSNNYMHKAVLQSEGFFLAMIKNMMSSHTYSFSYS